MLKRSKEEIELAFETFAEGCDELVKNYRKANYPSLPENWITVYPGRG